MTFREFVLPLYDLYPQREAQWVGRMVMDVKYGLTREDLMMGKEEQIDSASLSEVQQQLLTGCPVQYVLGTAYFCGRMFHVKPGVLIPRPETGELCRWIVDENKGKESLSMLDIGTGSGCIACTLAAELQGVRMNAWDISDQSLEVAAENSRLLGVCVALERVDILSEHEMVNRTEEWNVIVSNPPYICQSERKQMHVNVVDFEPETALFVPDDDPLLFYRAIGRYAMQSLKAGGLLYLEANEALAHETSSLLTDMGMSSVTVRKDQYGKERFIRACRQERK